MKPKVNLHAISQQVKRTGRPADMKPVVYQAYADTVQNAGNSRSVRSIMRAIKYRQKRLRQSQSHVSQHDKPCCVIVKTDKPIRQEVLMSS